MNTVRMTAAQLAEIKEKMSQTDKETAIFLLAGVFRTESGVHFTVRRVLAPTETDYDARSRYHIQVSPIFFNKAISLAEANEVTIIQCHSHPDSTHLQYSPTDNSGESASAQTLQDCIGKPMGSLLFGKDTIIGRVWLHPHKKPAPINEIRLVDRRYRKKLLTKQKKINIDENIYDRQIRAFGLRGQKLLSQLKIGIVGLGGTGSAVAEQLAREGITNFIIMDHDVFEPSNKTRIYGSHHNDAKKPKTSIIKRNILQIEPKATIKIISKKLTSENDIVELLDCDVVFSCVDRHTPRSFLNNLSYQYGISVIDVGVGLDSENEMIVGGHIRATLLGPTLPCLFCTGIIDPDTILAESMPKKELDALQKEGYIHGLTDDVPAVIEFTSMAASMGVLLLKDLLFGVLRTNANTLVLDITTFQSSRLSASSKPDCVCNARHGKGALKWGRR
jgi:molybdopterin/thiamine biosynthesis adenylyltransferase